MKLSIIGAVSKIGSATAYAVAQRSLVSEICLIDPNEQLAQTYAQDIFEASSLFNSTKIYSGDYSNCKDSDIVIIASANKKNLNDTLSDTIERNKDLFLTILENITRSGFKKELIVLIESSPVDIFTYFACKKLNLPSNQIIGLGTLVQSARLSNLLAKELDLPANQLNALVLGENGEKMFPIYSSASISGLNLSSFKEFNIAMQNRVFQAVKSSEENYINNMGGSYWSSSSALAKIVEAIVKDSKTILPVSSLINGVYQIRDVALSVPCLVGKNGVERQLELELWQKEKNQLDQASSYLKRILASLSI